MSLTKKRQALEDRILEDLREFGYRGTSGSGNKLGDGDIKPFHIDRGVVQFGFECKDNTKKEHHGMPKADWNKAKSQIAAAGFDPVFVTRNSNFEIVAHLQWDSFIELLDKALSYDTRI